MIPLSGPYNSPMAKLGTLLLLALSMAASAPSDADIRKILVDRIDGLVDLATDLKPKERTQAAIDPLLLDRYVGCYQMAQNFILSITRNGNRLFAQATGQGRFEIFPEGDKDFFAKVADIQMAFVVDAAGPAGSIVVHQQGINTPARRVE